MRLLTTYAILCRMERERRSSEGREREGEGEGGREEERERERERAEPLYGGGERETLSERSVSLMEERRELIGGEYPPNCLK